MNPMIRPMIRSSKCEALEPRTLFATTPLALRPLVDSRHVAAAFVTFDQTYMSDVKTILFATGTTPASQRAAFDQAVGAALNTLNSTIDTDISDLPAQASLSSTIQVQLIGSGSTTLQSELAALVTPTGPGTAGGFKVNSQVDIGKNAASVIKEVLTSPTGLISASMLLGDLAKVATDFATFAKTDGNDAKTILFGSSNPSANRPAFDAAIASALNTLNASIDTDVSNLPASVAGPLDTTIQNDLLTGSSLGKSLQDKLAAISTPNGSGFIASFVFNVASKIQIAAAGIRVGGDIASAVHHYNFSS
jgi:hypothetical protein